MIALFFRAFAQVALVSASTVFIAKENYIGTFVVGFGISWLWTGNVKKVAFGTKKERVAYAAGAACGSLFGLLVASSL